MGLVEVDSLHCSLVPPRFLCIGLSSTKTARRGKRYFDHFIHLDCSPGPFGNGFGMSTVLPGNRTMSWFSPPALSWTLEGLVLVDYFVNIQLPIGVSDMPSSIKYAIHI